ncbi:hypothetical protein B0H16DRAFT_1463103 [Mycena metata]|uniref:Uncharacterized protein n=1 Tax=Mycena metata TaxID=1033252 RepID=A0AAD7N410_9AGAR|nr:hypothetical protein B0H16DRAFT_1463103 [Mycena metata]
MESLLQDSLMITILSFTFLHFTSLGPENLRTKNSFLRFFSTQPSVFPLNNDPTDPKFPSQSVCLEVDFEAVPLNCERHNQLTKVRVESGRLAQLGRTIVAWAQATEFTYNSQVG